MLPTAPDASARRLRDRFAELGIGVAVIVSDTFGRPWREGQTDVAVYHQATVNWYIRLSSTGALRLRAWGWNQAAPAFSP